MFLRNFRFTMRIFLILCLLTIGLARAEVARFELLGLAHKGTAAGDEFGYDVTSVGQWTSSGYSHIAIGSPGVSSDRGKVIIRYKLATGGSWFNVATFIGEATGDRFSQSAISLPDITGDGDPELVIGAPKFGASNTGAVYIYESGTTPGSSFSYTTPYLKILPFYFSASNTYFGESIGDCDVNDDGKADLIIGAPGEDKAYLYKWAEIFGNVQYYRSRTHTGQSGSGFGSSVSGVGDVNDDGYEDYLVGAPDWADANGDKVGAAFLYSGLNGSLLWTESGVFGPGNQPEALYGQGVAGVGDWNGDGVDDFVVGAPGTTDPVTNNCCQGIVHVYKGSAGSSLGDLLYSQRGDPNWHPVRFGYSIAGNIDFGSNGYPDLVAGSPWSGWDISNEDSAFGITNVIDGEQGDYLASILGTGADVGMNPGLTAMGFSVALAGDVDGDLLQDIITGGPFIDDNGDDKGHVAVYRSYYLADVNASLMVDVTDLVYLADYVDDNSNPAPIPLASGDLNEDGDVDCDDVDCLIAYIFSSGPLPCP